LNRKFIKRVYKVKKTMTAVKEMSNWNVEKIRKD